MDSRKAIRDYCDLAFDVDDEMSLMATASQIKAEQLALKSGEPSWSVEEILWHVGFWKLEYCRQGFALEAPAWKWPKGDMPEILKTLRVAHQHMLACLANCSAADLEKSVPTKCHGESAAHLFSVLAMHDIAHAAQLRAILRGAGVRKGGWYPIEMK
ncbi:DinB family protein [Candidatus Sumerlaeota bacterium]